MTLSVCIITLNEEANLPRTLESVRWADEIVVVDSGSTDRTLEIARSAHAHILAGRNYPDAHGHPQDCFLDEPGPHADDVGEHHAPAPASFRDMNVDRRGREGIHHHHSVADASRRPLKRTVSG